MCSRYTVKKDEAKIKLREMIQVFGFVPRGDIRPTDFAPVILPAKRAQAGGKQKGDVPPGAETAKDEHWNPFAWKHNALRHSFISYRVAATQDVAKVSLEAGNSPQMIFRHYRELVRPADAVKWFAIAPK